MQNCIPETNCLAQVPPTQHTTDPSSTEVHLSKEINEESQYDNVHKHKKEANTDLPSSQQSEEKHNEDESRKQRAKDIVNRIKKINSQSQSQPNSNEPKQNSEKDQQSKKDTSVRNRDSNDRDRSMKRERSGHRREYENDRKVGYNSRSEKNKRDESDRVLRKKGRKSRTPSRSPKRVQITRERRRSPRNSRSRSQSDRHRRGSREERARQNSRDKYNDRNYRYRDESRTRQHRRDRKQVRETSEHRERQEKRLRDQERQHRSRRSPSLSPSKHRSDSDNDRKYQKRRQVDRSRRSRERRQSRERSESGRRRERRKGQNRREKKEEVHPYFQKSSRYVEDNNVFWDGFQWVNKQDYIQNQSHINQSSSNLQQGNGNDLTADSNGQHDEEGKNKKFAQSKTVIIEGLLLDLGLTEAEIIRFIREKLECLGESTSKEALQIIDIDLNPFNSKVNNNCISIQVADIFMVGRLKRLNGTICLGQQLTVRKQNEETEHSNAQASAIAIQAMLDLQQSRFKKVDDNNNQKSDAQDDKAKENSSTVVQASLKTLSPSPVIKISNVHDRDQPITDEQLQELQCDMQQEISGSARDLSQSVKRIKVIKDSEQRLGAEIGSVFCEFHTKKDAQVIINKLQGRIYDGRPICVCFIEESLYFSELYI